MNNTMTTEATIAMMNKLAVRRGFVYGVAAVLAVKHVGKKLDRKMAVWAKEG